MKAGEYADSVFRYIDRTAMACPAGYRWRTLGYDNKYTEEARGVFNGVAGTGLFLADYGSVRKNARALELARGALDWCMVSSPDAWDGPSLMFGDGGLAWAWLHLSAASGAREGIEHAARIGERVAAEATNSSEWGTCTDLIGGVAGSGMLMLRLWRVTGEKRWLDAATGMGRWLADRKVETDFGAGWPFIVGGKDKVVFWGAAHGLAGIATFMAGLHEATKAKEWRELGMACARTLERAGVEDHGGVNWNRGPGAEPASRCQWCHGSPGVGLFLVQAARILGEPGLLALAERAGEAVVGYGDCRGNPSLCHGLAGNAELLVELYRATGRERWLGEAGKFVDMISKYRVEEQGKEAWQADEPGFTSPDFLCGAAGTGHLLLQVETAGELARALP